MTEKEKQILIEVKGIINSEMEKIAKEIEESQE